jgi:hypothetical protein
MVILPFNSRQHIEPVSLWIRWGLIYAVFGPTAIHMAHSGRWASIDNSVNGMTKMTSVVITGEKRTLQSRMLALILVT